MFFVFLLKNGFTNAKAIVNILEAFQCKLLLDSMFVNKLK